MSNIRSTGMSPELGVRRLVHALGYRFRLHRKDLPGKPDLVFGPKRKVIFVHGCFWHSHDDPKCLDGRKPKSNTSYWTPKLEKNKERDRRNVEELSALGWQVLTIWECETKNMEKLNSRIVKFLSK